MLLLNKFIYLNKTYCDHYIYWVDPSRDACFRLFTRHKDKQIWTGTYYNKKGVFDYSYKNRNKNLCIGFCSSWRKGALYLSTLDLKMNCALYIQDPANPGYMSRIEYGDTCVLVDLEKKSLREHFNELCDKDIMARNAIKKLYNF